MSFFGNAIFFIPWLLVYTYTKVNLEQKSIDLFCYMFD